LEEAVRVYLVASKREQVRTLTLHIGIATYPEESRDAAELLNKARGGNLCLIRQRKSFLLRMRKN
jgi:GGDEF domain-containing protein